MSSGASPRPTPAAADLTPAAPRGASLRWRLVTVLLTASLLPLALLGGGAWLVFGGLLEQKSLDLHREVVRSHSAAIDRYVDERKRALTLLARTHGLAEMSKRAVLQRAFGELERDYDEAFVDLGVIDASGRHLAYVGPYDLGDKNYSSAAWFQHVMAHGSYVSDVFLGFRGVPHCIIAVRRDEQAGRWILRATINSDKFDALVRTEPLGSSAAAYIINDAGVYQTPPPHGAVLERSSLGAVEPHEGLRTTRVTANGVDTFRVTAGLNDHRWLLVVEQPAAEVRAPLRRAMGWGALLAALAVCLVVATTVVATWHLTREIDGAIAQRNLLSRELVRSARLASLGELATGLAHEINNPLAIISSERTNLGDAVGDLTISAEQRGDFADSLDRIRRQVERCSAITAKMLRFGRKTESTPEATELGPRLREIAAMMHKQAEVRNVAIHVEVEPDLPLVVLDPTELEQVLVNLVQNSLQALPDGGQIRLRARRAGAGVVLSVEDDGAGIAPQDLDRVFQPFFTTKPVGQGTGLGLAVCYGLVRGWGGTIDVESELGRGTTLSIHLPPVAAPPPTPDPAAARAHQPETESRPW